MVRFIMHDNNKPLPLYFLFTFQYGQIYYLEEAIIELHFKIFTFQYGQIYYKNTIINYLKNYIFTFQYGQIYYALFREKYRK